MQVTLQNGSQGTAMDRLADHVVACTNENCPDGAVALADGVPPVCPRCDEPLQLRDHTPVLHLYEERGEAQYEPAANAWIAGTEGRKLYPRHVSKEEAASADEPAVAEVEYNDGLWGLRNHGLVELRVIRNGRTERVVPIGEVVTLHDGLTLLLAPAPAGRAIVVSRFELSGPEPGGPEP